MAVGFGAGGVLVQKGLDGGSVEAIVMEVVGDFFEESC